MGLGNETLFIGKVMDKRLMPLGSEEGKSKTRIAMNGTEMRARATSTM